MDNVQGEREKTYLAVSEELRMTVVPSDMILNITIIFTLASVSR